MASTRAAFAEPAPGSARVPLRPINAQLDSTPSTAGGFPKPSSRPSGISRWMGSPPDNAALYGASPTLSHYTAAPPAPEPEVQAPEPPTALETALAENAALRARLDSSEAECSEALLYISTLQAEAVELRSAATTQQLGWLAEALGAEAVARADAAAEAAARKEAEQSCVELEGRLAEALQATVELETELANVWEARLSGASSPGDNQASDAASEEAAALRSENEALRAQIAGFGAAPAELEKAKERARKYKGLARELHARLRQLTLSHCEELAVVRAQLRSAYSAAAASSDTASPPLLTPSARQ